MTHARSALGLETGSVLSSLLTEILEIERSLAAASSVPWLYWWTQRDPDQQAYRPRQHGSEKSHQSRWFSSELGVAIDPREATEEQDEQHHEGQDNE